MHRPPRVAHCTALTGRAAGAPARRPSWLAGGMPPGRLFRPVQPTLAISCPANQGIYSIAAQIRWAVLLNNYARNLLYVYAQPTTGISLLSLLRVHLVCWYPVSAHSGGAELFRRRPAGVLRITNPHLNQPTEYGRLPTAKPTPELYQYDSPLMIRRL